jgi:hypothetical protein
MILIEKPVLALSRELQPLNVPFRKLRRTKLTAEDCAPLASEANFMLMTIDPGHFPSFRVNGDFS